MDPKDSSLYQDAPQWYKTMMDEESKDTVLLEQLTARTASHKLKYEGDNFENMIDLFSISASDYENHPTGEFIFKQK